ncbi:MAG: flavodoxin family protein [Dehalococcoidia bacterium]|nr:MAG: flavodoxin family protein [Dehalococcoidia bacterium]
MNWVPTIRREATRRKIEWVLGSMMRERGKSEADKALLIEACRFVFPTSYEARFKKVSGEINLLRDLVAPAFQSMEGYYTYPRLIKRVSLDVGKPPKPANQMKVMAFTAGPRQGGNSDTLVAEALRGARDAGAATESIRLVDLEIGRCFSTLLIANYQELKKLHPGREFLYCKDFREKAGASQNGCAMDDKMSEAYAKIEAADALLVSFPVYTDWETSMLAGFIERWTRYEHCLGTHLSPGRRGMVISTWGTLTSRIYEHVTDHVIQNLYLRQINVVEKIIGCGFVGLYSGLDENYHGIANHFPKIMEMTYLAGRALVTGERNQKETVVETRAPGQMEPVKTEVRK